MFVCLYVCMFVYLQVCEFVQLNFRVHVHTSLIVQPA